VRFEGQPLPFTGVTEAAEADRDAANGPPRTVRITAILIGYLEDPSETARAIASLRRQTRPPDEFLLVDNSGKGRHRAMAESEGAIYVDPGRNLGFAAGVNLAAERASGDRLLLINPDSSAEPECLARLESALESKPGASIAGAQVLLPDGTVNAGDNPIHLSGLAWSGNLGREPETGDPRGTLSVSGAAMLVDAVSFRELGGFHPGIFMYFEDTDLAWRSRIAGREVLFCPDARVAHDYEFAKADSKWRWLEEGRISAVLTNYQPRTLFLLSPLLVATELATWAAAVRGGWARQKAGAWVTIWRNRRLLGEWRTRVAGLRQVSDGELLPEFAQIVETPLLESRSAGIFPGLQRAYARLVSKLA
jgi:GT2 family glycosyltransferase